MYAFDYDHYNLGILMTDFNFNQVLFSYFNVIIYICLFLLLLLC